MKGVVVIELSRYRVRNSLFLQLLGAFSVTKDDFTDIFTKMLSADGSPRLETQAYIRDFEETAVSLGHEPNELTDDFEAVMEVIKRKIPPWIDFGDVVSVWFRTETNILIFHR